MRTQGIGSRKAPTALFILFLASAGPAPSDVSCPSPPVDPSCAATATHQTFVIDGHLPPFYAVKNTSSPSLSFNISVDDSCCHVKMKVNTFGPFTTNLDEPPIYKDWDFSTTGDCGFGGGVTGDCGVRPSATGTVTFHPTQGDSIYTYCLYVAHDSGNPPTLTCKGDSCGCVTPGCPCDKSQVEIRLEGHVLDRATNLLIAPPNPVTFDYSGPGPPVAYPSAIVTITLSTDGGPESIRITGLKLDSEDPRFPLPLGYAQVVGPDPTDSSSTNHTVEAGQPVQFNIQLVPHFVRPRLYATPSVHIVLDGETSLTHTATHTNAELVVSTLSYFPSMPTLGAWGQLGLVLLLLTAGWIVLRRRHA
jgi:hypothetical protein